MGVCEFYVGMCVLNDCVYKLCIYATTTSVTFWRQSLVRDNEIIILLRAHTTRLQLLTIVINAYVEYRLVQVR